MQICSNVEIQELMKYEMVKRIWKKEGLIDIIKKLRNE
jgi:hypothetical protein